MNKLNFPVYRTTMIYYLLFGAGGEVVNYNLLLMNYEI